MKPRNKTEREIVKFSNMIPELSDKQREWAIKTCISEDDAYKYSDRFSRGCFYLVCTFKGWQVLRYFQVRVKFRFHKMVDEKIYFKECMQQWLRDGEYVFLAKQRFNGYIIDAFSNFSEMSVKTNTQWGMLGDPREIGWDGIYFASIQDKFKYALRDFSDKIDFDCIMRSVNIHPFNETLMRTDINIWKTCKYHNAVYNRNVMTTVKIVMRHGRTDYIYKGLWWDMIDYLIYLKKDIHNPSFVCPEDLLSAHDKYYKAFLRKKKKMEETMEKLRQIQMERRELAYIQERAQRENENKLLAKSVAATYVSKRKKFFDMDIVSGNIRIDVLQSVDEFFEEGKEMCHCVFSNGYYNVNNRPNCLILSAKVDGSRMETLEVDLSSLTIIQCHGKYNQITKYHDVILSLMKKNMWQVEHRMRN